jgi:hypothetical protein
MTTISKGFFIKNLVKAHDHNKFNLNSLFKNIKYINNIENIEPINYNRDDNG